MTTRDRKIPFDVAQDLARRFVAIEKATTSGITQASLLRVQLDAKKTYDAGVADRVLPATWKYSTGKP